MTLWDSMDCSLAGSSVHGILQAKKTGVSSHSLLQDIFPTQRSNPGLPHCRWILYLLSYHSNAWNEVKWKPLNHVQLFATPWTIHTVHGILQARTLEWVDFPFSNSNAYLQSKALVSASLSTILVARMVSKF